MTMDPDDLERELQAIANGERRVKPRTPDLQVGYDGPDALVLLAPETTVQDEEWIMAENPMEWTL
jgi:hypothetical protein